MEEILQQCRKHGLRVTYPLKMILQVLHDAEIPLSLQNLEGIKELKEICDRATIFRTLQRLEKVGMLRRINFAHSGARFTLNTGHSHREYLVCKECSAVQELDIACPIRNLEEKISSESDYTGISHELTFYGLCPNCA